MINDKIKEEALIRAVLEYVCCDREDAINRLARIKSAQPEYGNAYHWRWKDSVGEVKLYREFLDWTINDLLEAIEDLQKNFISMAEFAIANQ